MAKIKPGVVMLSGKLGDNVFVDSHVHEKHIRSIPKAGSKKDEDALKTQYKRTALLNELAGEINKITAVHGKLLKPNGFYHALHQRFRKQPLNHRFLLLMQLKGMEVDPKYPFSKHGHCEVMTRRKNRKMIVSLEVKRHPDPEQFSANCYYYETVLTYWQKNKKRASDLKQTSEWISFEKGLPVFEFIFSLPATTTHWMVFTRIKLGVNEREVPSVKADGMKVTEVGSWDKKDLSLLKKQKQESASKPIPRKKSPVARVKAKFYNKPGIAASMKL